MSSKPDSVSDESKKGSAIGRKACIDPETGKLVSPEERPECQRQVDVEPTTKGVTESAEGLEEETMPDGSTKIELGDRFKKHSQPDAP